jgi:hypothetical protein
MEERHRSDSRELFQSRGDTDTDDIDLSPLHESGMTQTFEQASRDRAGLPQAQLESEADIILIAHPENQRLGSRFRVSPGQRWRSAGRVRWGSACPRSCLSLASTPGCTSWGSGG